MGRTFVTFNAGCAISANNFYISSTVDELDHWDAFSRIFIYRYNNDSSWSMHDLDGWKVQSVSYLNDSTGRSLLSLDSSGNIEFFREDIEIHQNVFEDANENFIYGSFNVVNVIDNSVYVCGDGGRIFKNINGEWHNIGNGIEEDSIQINVNDYSFLEFDSHLGFKKNIYDINGFSYDNLYVCGTKGENGYISFFNGVGWNDLNKITPSALYGITICPDNENLLICGQYGTLLKGSYEKGFKNLKDISINSTFYNTAYYNDNIYIASEQGVYIFDGHKYSIIPNLSDVTGVIHIQEKDSVLWVLTYKQLIRYDGNTWNRISHPDNDEYETKLLKCEAGNVCPKTGQWFSPANNMKKRYFNKGETMPEIGGNSWGNTIWYLND